MKMFKYLLPLLLLSLTATNAFSLGSLFSSEETAEDEFADEEAIDEVEDEEEADEEEEDEEEDEEEEDTEEEALEEEGTYWSNTCPIGYECVAPREIDMLEEEGIYSRSQEGTCCPSDWYCKEPREDFSI